jgi:GNAT superfamily N-acetyltransferase
MEKTMIEILNNVRIRKCDFTDIKETVSEYYKKNKIIVDSFWEGQIRESNYYKIILNDEFIGYFAVNKGTVLVLFNILEEYRNISQELFTIIKKYENVREALIPTGDEFFISHAIDNYVKLEKQAYFAIYTDKIPKKIINIELELANIEKDFEILNLCHDFLKDVIEDIKKSIDIEIYIAKFDDNIIGFGIIDYQKIVNIYASTGMIVIEEHRQKGYGANILNELKKIASSKGYISLSGCWYYNHVSKKTMESAGAYSKTRLLKFYF